MNKQSFLNFFIFSLTVSLLFHCGISEQKSTSDSKNHIRNKSKSLNEPYAIQNYIKDKPLEKQFEKTYQNNSVLITVITNNGKKILNARVQFCEFERQKKNNYGRFNVVAEGLTNDEGKIIFSGIEKKRYRILVNKPGVSPVKKNYDIVAPGQKLTIVMVEGNVIQGLVTDINNNPVSEAIIYFREHKKKVHKKSRLKIKTKSDENGEYVIGFRPEVTFDIHAYKPGYIPKIIKNIESDESNKKVDIVLRPGAKFYGRITDSSDKPLKNISVRLYNKEFDIFDNMEGFKESVACLTDTAGRYAISNIPSKKKLTVIIKRENWPDVRIYLTDYNDSEDFEFNYKYEDAVDFTVIVKDSKNRLLKDYYLSFFSELINKESNIWYKKIDSDAPVEIKNFKAGDYTISITKDDYVSFREKIQVSNGVVKQINLQDAYTISGMVIDENNMPVIDEKVGLVNLDIRGGNSNVTNNFGEFFIDNLLPGKYSIKIRSQNYKAKEQHLEIYDHIKDYVFMVESLGDVFKGQVVNKKNEPVERSRVVLIKHDKVIKKRKPNKKGVFTFRKLQSTGPYNLVIETLDYKRYQQYIPDLKTLDTNKFILDPEDKENYIIGYLQDENENPIIGSNIYYAYLKDKNSGLQRSYTIKSGLEGKFKIKRKSEFVCIWIVNNDYVHTDRLIYESNIQNPVQIILQKGFDLHGKILNENCESLGGARVNLSMKLGKKKKYKKKTKTENSGNFILPHIPPDIKFYLTVQKSGYRTLSKQMVLWDGIKEIILRKK